MPRTRKRGLDKAEQSADVVDMETSDNQNNSHSASASKKKMRWDESTV